MTQFYEITITTSVTQLRKVLGKPNHAHNKGTGKCNFNWDAMLPDGSIFTVYDWKLYRQIDFDEKIEWHIGGNNKEDTEKAKIYLQSILE